MKIYIWVTIAVIIIISIALASLAWLNISTVRISDALQPISAAIEREDWDQAALLLEDFQEFWHKNSSLWHVIIDHQEIINIEVPLDKLTHYIAEKKAPEAGENIVEMQYWLEYIRRIEKITLNNIF